MKFTIEQNQLSKAMAKVIGAVERRKTIPILANVLIRAENNIVKLTTTDMDMEVTTSVECDVEQPGSTTVNAGMLSSIINKMAKGKAVTLELNGNYVNVTNGKAVFNLACLPPDDFPEFKAGEFTTSIDAPTSTIKKLVDKTAWAQSTEEVRYYLNGIYLHSVDGKLTAVATDGHKLARSYSDIETDLTGIIIPRKTVAEIAAHLDGDNCTIQANATKIRVVCGDTVIASKVIDGTFPDYTRVIPQSSDLSVTGDAVELKSASELVSLVSQERTRAVKLTFTKGHCELKVDGQNGDKGCETVEVDYDDEDGKAVAFNSKYLADALSKCEGTVTLGFGDMTPVVITSSDDPDSLFVVMPMRS